MAIVFPINPSVNDTFTVGSITYKWDSTKWIGLGVTPIDKLIEGSNSLEITAGNELIWTGGKVGVNQVTPIAIFHAKSGANDGTLVSTFEGATNNKLNIRFDIFGPVLDVTAGDPLAFEIGGSEKMRLDGSGRLLKSGQAALTSTSLNHPIQVTAASDANAIAIIGRASDDIGELSFYEADKGTKLGELQYRQDHLNLRCRVGDIRFASGGTAETLRIDGSGRIAQGERTPTNHGSPNLLLWGADTTLHLTSTGSTNNISFAGIKFAVAGGSTGDYSKAGIFVQRQSSYNDLDMIFAFRSTNDADGVAISDEKLRINSDGNVSITAIPTTNASKLFIRANSGADAGRWSHSCLALYNTTTIGEYSQMGLGYTVGTWAPSYFGFVSTSQASYGYGDLVFGTRNATTDSQPTERLRIDANGKIVHTGGHANNSGNLNAGTYHRINASYAMAASQNVTFVVSGLASGWMTIRGGGYSNAGQSQYSVMYQLGGYMTAANKYDVVTVQQWGSGVTISTVKNAQDFRVTLTNNSGSYSLLTNWCIESNNAGLKIRA